jgi:hypothetical protein
VQQSALFETLDALRQWWESKEGYGKRLLTGLASGKTEPGATQAIGHVGDVLHPDDFDRLCRPLVDHVLASLCVATGGAEMVATQTPENMMLWRFIRRLVPNARFLHVIRDPRAVLASQRAASKSWARGVFAADAESVARLWGQYMEAAAELQQAGVSQLDVRYERLRANPTAELARIFAWLELPASPEFVKSAIENCSLDKMRHGNLGPPDFVRTGLAEGWREELGSAEIRSIEYFVAPLMRKLGYEPVSAHPERMPLRLAIRHIAHRALGPLIGRLSIATRTVLAWMYALIGG